MYKYCLCMIYAIWFILFYLPLCSATDHSIFLLCPYTNCDSLILTSVPLKCLHFFSTEQLQNDSGVFCLMPNWVTFPVMLPGNPEACAHAPPQGHPLSSWTLEALARAKCCGCYCPTKAGWCCWKGAGKCFRDSWQHLRLQNLCVQREKMCLKMC